MVATICFFFLTIYKWRIKTCDSIPLRMNYIFGNGRYAELVRTSIKFYGQQNIEAFIVDHEYILDDVLSRPQITLEKISSRVLSYKTAHSLFFHQQDMYAHFSP